MNLDLIWASNETGLLLSVTKNRETLFKQTRTKPQETFELRLTQSTENFSFKSSDIHRVDSKGMIGLTSLQV